MKKLIAFTAMALVLAACTPKTPTPTGTNNNYKTMAPVMSTKPSPTTTMVKESTSGAMMPEGKQTFKLTAQNSSKQDGTATFEEVAGKVKVTLALASATTAAEPAHIHLGSCPSPTDVKYPLTDVVSGKSETTLPAGVTLKSLGDLGKLAVNVHKSATDLKTYVSCGNIELSETTMKASAAASAKVTATTKASATAKASASPDAMSQ